MAGTCSQLLVGGARFRRASRDLVTASLTSSLCAGFGAETGKVTLTFHPYLQCRPEVPEAELHQIHLEDHTFRGSDSGAGGDRWVREFASQQVPGCCCLCSSGGSHWENHWYHGSQTQMHTKVTWEPRPHQDQQGGARKFSPASKLENGRCGSLLCGPQDQCHGVDRTQRVCAAWMGRKQAQSQTAPPLRGRVC